MNGKTYMNLETHRPLLESSLGCVLGKLEYLLLNDQPEKAFGYRLQIGAILRKTNKFGSHVDSNMKPSVTMVKYKEGGYRNISNLKNIVEIFDEFHVDADIKKWEKICIKFYQKDPIYAVSDFYLIDREIRNIAREEYFELAKAARKKDRESAAQVK